MAVEKNAQISNIVPHYAPHFVPHSVPQSTKLVMCHIFVSQSSKFKMAATSTWLWWITIGGSFWSTISKSLVVDHFWTTNNKTKWRPAKWRQISLRSNRGAFSLVMADLIKGPSNSTNTTGIDVLTRGYRTSWTSSLTSHQKTTLPLALKHSEETTIYVFDDGLLHCDQIRSKWRSSEVLDHNHCTRHS